MEEKSAHTWVNSHGWMPVGVSQEAQPRPPRHRVGRHAYRSVILRGIRWAGTESIAWEGGDMSLTTILSREHQVILSRLGELEDALKDLDLAMLEDVLRFFEADLPLHRRKEEEILFPVLARHIGAEGGPISAMLAEHETEKAYLGDLRRAVNEVKSGADGRISMERW